MNPTFIRRTRFAARGQQGVALLVALVVLVIIGLTSASVMRGALSTDLIANNARVQTLAAQAAQAALRYCEDQTLDAVFRAGRVLAPNPPDQWNVWANWEDPAMVNTVPVDRLESANSTMTPATLPQCMVQEVVVGATTAYQVTARGFSPDYSDDGAGRTATGSVVWLQSIVSL